MPGRLISTLLALVIGLSSVTASPIFASVGRPPSSVDSPASNQWIPVPGWLAGTWRANSEVILYSRDFQKRHRNIQEPIVIKITRESPIGAQRSADGITWHYLGIPYQRSIKTDSYFELQEIRDLSVVKNTVREVVVKTIAQVRRIDTSGNLIDTFKEETLTSYTPLEDGLILVIFSIMDFDLNGSSLHSSLSTCVESRVRPFQIINKDHRGDLRAKFIEFLNRESHPSDSPPE